MLKSKKIILIALGITMTLAYGYVKLALPVRIRSVLGSAIEKNCASCRFVAEEIKVSVIPLRVDFIGIRFVSGNVNSTLFDMRAEKIRMNVSFRKLFNRVVRFKKITIENGEFIVTEGDQKSSRSSEENADTDWIFEIEHIRIGNSKFIYNRIHGGKTATLHIHNIRGGIGPIGNTEKTRELKTDAQIAAVFEKSGKLKVTGGSFLFDEKFNAEIAVELDQFDLTELNPFFETQAGIRFSGILVHSHSSVSVKGASLHSRVEAKYTGLKIGFFKTDERSELVTLFTNLLARFRKDQSRTRTAKIIQEKDEPPVGFILHGMREAALKVATD